MMSRRCCCYHVSDANVVDYPSSLATGPCHDVIWSAGTLPLPELVFYVNIHY
ncbi:hypothetical protein CsSME_00020031 [Camellia sinensis var. sinensis]